MNIAHLTAIGTGAAKIASNPAVKSWFRRLFHKLYKKMMLGKVCSVIVEDATRARLHLDVNDKKFVIVNLEIIMKSMNSDAENGALANLKVTSPEMYERNVQTLLKGILNALRSEYKKKCIIVALSSASMAKKLHIKKFEKYRMNKELFLEMIEKAPVKEKEFLVKQRQTLDDAVFEYSSVEQLQDHLNKKYK
jgi:hypothetical protein